MKKKILIYGAGAIGRGYLPWVFSEKYHDFFFVDINKSLITLLKKNINGIHGIFDRGSQYGIEKLKLKCF